MSLPEAHMLFSSSVTVYGVPHWLRPFRVPRQHKELALVLFSLALLNPSS